MIMYVFVNKLWLLNTRGKQDNTESWAYKDSISPTSKGGLHLPASLAFGDAVPWVYLWGGWEGSGSAPPETSEMTDLKSDSRSQYSGR